MNRYIIFFFPLLLATGVAAQSTTNVPSMAPAAQAYLDAALDSLERTSLRRATTDWRAVRDSAHLLAAGAQRPDQTYGAIAWALGRVDRHSFLQAPFPGVNSELLGGRIGYLRIPFHPAGSSVQLADTLQHVLRELDAGGACSWIVDLRMNGGGNVWPMYAGIGPLLGDSILNAVLRDGKLVPGALYVDGAAIAIDDDGSRVTAARAAEPYVMRHPDAPVAVLLDAATGSSAEAVAIAFRTRPNTRFFGAPTAGLTTANRGVRLADQANMVVTVDAMTDAEGREYAAPLEPDERVPMPAGFWPSSVDAVARRAAEWLLAQQDCPAR